MRVSMSVSQSVEFLENHAAAIECGLEEDGISSLLLGKYEIKEICAIKCLVWASSVLKEIRPDLMNHMTSYEYNSDSSRK